MYVKYGEDYIPPCENYATDSLNDSSAKQAASNYFKALQSISYDMLTDLQPIMLEKCFMTVRTLQISGA